MCAGNGYPGSFQPPAALFLLIRWWWLPSSSASSTAFDQMNQESTRLFMSSLLQSSSWTALQLLSSQSVVKAASAYAPSPRVAAAGHGDPGGTDSCFSLTGNLLGERCVIRVPEVICQRLTVLPRFVRALCVTGDVKSRTSCLVSARLSVAEGIHIRGVRPGGSARGCSELFVRTLCAVGRSLHRRQARHTHLADYTLCGSVRGSSQSPVSEGPNLPRSRSLRRWWSLTARCGKLSKLFVEVFMGMIPLDAARSLSSRDLSAAPPTAAPERSKVVRNGRAAAETLSSLKESLVHGPCMTVLMHLRSLCCCGWCVGARALAFKVEARPYGRGRPAEGGNPNTLRRPAHPSPALREPSGT
ncbi:hypothetical protein BDV95DRAFT_600054 [Massariosphaeria phaeospora]|uniref:Secreted protein n=1 Tax=Massariosphaeria phaeospora TaxID=100035 RepID=A0A7C8M3Y6_9PLEO|nr:hypothetical protein BDV95DRAFT_600054 [Massariosphaeria phaeospora]